MSPVSELSRVQRVGKFIDVSEHIEPILAKHKQTNQKNQTPNPKPKPFLVKNLRIE